MKAFIRLLVPIVAIGWATSSEASLTIEPEINFVPGSGPTATSFPLYQSRVRQSREWRTSLSSKPTWRDRHRFDRVPY